MDLMQVQYIHEVWGWDVGIALFLTGLGAMTIFFSSYLDLKGSFPELTIMGTVAGTILVIIAPLFFLHDLGQPNRFYYLYTHGVTKLGDSWMARGIFLITSLQILGILDTLQKFKWFKGGFTWPARLQARREVAVAQEDFKNLSNPDKVLKILAMVFGVLATVYTGFLLSSAVGSPMWNSFLPVLFLVSGASTGVMLLMFLVKFVKDTGVQSNALIYLSRIEFWILFIEIPFLFLWLRIASSNPANAAGIATLLWGEAKTVFWGEIIAVGMALPLLLLLALGKIKSITFRTSIVAVLTVMILFAGAVVRHTVLSMGYVNVPVIPYEQAVPIPPSFHLK
ncbi:MAG: polysulfide reductase NrfD [Desulfitobacteriaceae bacterium]|nr:polysulfide reductase NrfD [Desulfitobacteriaceae bacterium]MDI6913543.1 polysulfide reductase NrfD [Desulfitobacteriaceae bacterium]